ncbi:hypothetical protein Tco_1094175 [Tanacetum coccineum]|uniref:Uncharacterized protein n=1 Tax=Tanacetum coccineum TaxID=301880 RepID=A0ABQ5IET4_9ASTR
MVQKPRSKRTRFGCDEVAVEFGGVVAVGGDVTVVLVSWWRGGDEVMKVVWIWWCGHGGGGWRGGSSGRWWRLRRDNDGGGVSAGGRGDDDGGDEGMVTGENVNFAELVWELLPFSRFTKLIIKHILSKNNNISKRPHSYQHVIKIDQVLRNLKFSNKGVKDPVFGMPIPMVMLNDEIKASAKYSKSLEKSKGSKPVKARSRGKGLLSKEGVEITMERISIAKRRRSKTVFEKTGQSEEVVDTVDSEETEEDEEPQLTRRRQSGVVICGNAHQEFVEEVVDHSKKLKRIELPYVTAQFQIYLKKARKTSKDDFISQECPRGSGEGSGVTLEVPDELTHKSLNEGFSVTLAVPDEAIGSFDISSSESENEERFLTTDEEKSDADADAKKKADDEKETEEQVEEEQAEVEQPIDDQGDNVEARDVQPEVNVTKTHIEKHEATILSYNPAKVEIQSMVDILIHQEKLTKQRPPLVDTIITLIPESTTLSPKQPPQTQQKRSKMKQILKKSKKPKTQVDIGELDSRVAKLEKTVNAMSRFNLPKAIDKSVQAHLKNILPKDAPDFDPPTQKKRRRDDQDQDPPKDSEIKKKRNDADTSSSKKGKTQSNSLKSTKVTPRPSTTKKVMDDDEKLQDGAVDDAEIEQDANMAVDDVPQDDTDPTQDRSTWFKQDVVVRPKTPDPECHKEPNAKDAPKQTWFSELVNAEKDPLTFDDLIGSTIDFTKNIERKYASSLTKTKAARYDLVGIEEMIPRLWSSVKEAYDKNADGFPNVSYFTDEERKPHHVMKSYQEADFFRLDLNDIEDMFLLYIQHKLHNLIGDEIVDLMISLRIFNQSIFIKRKVEDVQLGVESY